MMFTVSVLTCSVWVCTTTLLRLGVATFGANRQAFTNTVEFAVQSRNVGDSSGIRMPKLCVYAFVQLGPLPLPWQICCKPWLKVPLNSTEARTFDRIRSNCAFASAGM